MSLADHRQEIADALADVDGVKAYAFPPKATKAGDAWPLLEGLERGPAHDFEVMWRVVVVLPPGGRAASDWFDNHYEPVADALADFGHVERIDPGRMDTEAGDLDILILTVRREA